MYEQSKAGQKVKINDDVVDLRQVRVNNSRNLLKNHQYLVAKQIIVTKLFTIMNAILITLSPGVKSSNKLVPTNDLGADRQNKVKNRQPNAQEYHFKTTRETVCHPPVNKLMCA